MTALAWSPAAEVLPTGDDAIARGRIGPIRYAWQLEAACAAADPELFTQADGGLAELLERARSYCVNCPVAQDCLNTGLLSPTQSGIWGGRTSRERRSIIRQMQQAIAQADLDGSDGDGLR